MTAVRWTTGPDVSRRCTETVLMQFGIMGKRPDGVLGMLEAFMTAGFRLRPASTGRQTVAEFCADRPTGCGGSHPGPCDLGEAEGLWP